MRKEIKQHQVLNKFVVGLAKGFVHSLVIVSKGGTGKTETVLLTLRELGLTEEEDYIYINNYITPLELYFQLQRVNELEDPKILILDDGESLFGNMKTVGLLKSALWELPYGERKVCWYSTSSKINVNEFIFNGKIIFLLNKLDKKNPVVNAFATRGYYYEMNLSNKEMLDLMKKRTELPYKHLKYSQRRKVFEVIRKYGRQSQALNLRILPMSYNLFILSPQHHQTLIKEILK